MGRAGRAAGRRSAGPSEGRRRPTMAGLSTGTQGSVLTRPQIRVSAPVAPHGWDQAPHTAGGQGPGKPGGAWMTGPGVGEPETPLPGNAPGPGALGAALPLWVPPSSPGDLLQSCFRACRRAALSKRLGRALSGQQQRTPPLATRRPSRSDPGQEDGGRGGGGAPPDTPSATGPCRQALTASPPSRATGAPALVPRAHRL